MSLSRFRTAITLFFVIHGFVYAGWVSRIPAIKAQVGATSGSLGLALLGMSGGAVATMLMTGALCRRFGSRPMTVVTCVLFSLTIALPPMTHSPLTLGLALLVFGAAYGGLNVAMNSVAVDIVAAIGRPIMPSFHAAWSFAGLAGAALGALVAPYLSPAQHLLILVAAGLAVTAVAGVMLLRGALPVAPEARRERHPSARAVRGAGLFAVGVLGLIALCDTYGEGAIGDWGALHIRENLHTDQRVAAAGYAAYALAAAVGRLGGTALLQRLGHTRVLVAGGLVAGAGTLLAALAPVLWLVFVGFAIAGLGLANIFPTAMARVGYLAGATGVAIGSTLGYTGFLLGPPAIGFLAGAVGLPVALTTVPLLAFAVAAIAYSASRASRSAEIAENEEVYG